jgi:integrase
MQIDLKYVKAYRDRTGKWRYYLRKRGYKPIPLKGEPGSDEFLESRREAMETRKDISSPGLIMGSIGALCREYQDSAEFTELAESTRREMGYVLAGLSKKHGDKLLRHLKRSHIMSWKDALKNKPGAANKMLRTIKALLAYAVLKEYLTANPAEKIKLMKLGRYRAWSDEELRLFEVKWERGTLERMIFDLALYTGQRRGDLAAMRRDQVLGNNIRLTQHKTGTDLVIRVHNYLAASMGAFLSTHKAKTIIAGPTGTAIHPFTMAAIFRDACRTANLPMDCVLHGLRKTTARILAELGMKSSPITGHLTRAMQDEYERDANQEKMGTAAILSWEKASKKKAAKR